MDIKGEINSNTVIAVLTPILTSMDKSSRKKINKETAALNDILDQINLIVSSEDFTPKQQNIHSFQVHIEYFLG